MTTTDPKELMEIRKLHTGNKKHRSTTLEICADAKAYGLAHGYYGELGGWIYDQNGQHIAHGWGQFYFAIGRFAIENWKRSIKENL